MIWLHSRRNGGAFRRPTRLELLGTRPGAVYFRVAPMSNFTTNIGDEIALRVTNGGRHRFDEAARDVRRLMDALVRVALMLDEEGS